jgi:hypothetical protein
LYEGSARLKELTNRYLEVLFLNPTVNTKYESLGSAPSCDDATPSISFLFFNFRGRGRDF